MHSDTHPPTQFTHPEWESLRDALYAAKTNKSTDDKCRRLYEIALAMNKLQPTDCASEAS